MIVRIPTLLSCQALFIFIAMCFPHSGKNWEFWRWGTVPFVMYLVERFFLRYRKAERKVILKEINYIKPVLNLRFQPEGFKYAVPAAHP